MMPVAVARRRLYSAMLEDGQGNVVALGGMPILLDQSQREHGGTLRREVVCNAAYVCG